jgi:hypothetical protein
MLRGILFSVITLLACTASTLSYQLQAQDDGTQFGMPLQPNQNPLGPGEQLGMPLQQNQTSSSQNQGPQYGLPLPSNDQIQQEIQQISAQIKQLEAKRDRIKQDLGYFTNETTGYQESNGLTYSQNRDRETYYQAQLEDLENQIASLKNKKDQLSMIGN